MKTSTYLSVLGFGALALAQDHGEEAAQEMGPVAFMWPPDRVWGATQDNTAPCGSSSGVVNRTEFPLINGQVALVMQEQAWHVWVSIAHDEDPTSNDDFDLLIDAHHIPDIDPGHECYPLPQNTTSGIQAGSNATLQIMYTADFNDEGESTGNNETFYACSDITFVEVAQFTYQVPCFNATVPEFSLPTEGDDEDSSEDESESETEGDVSTSPSTDSPSSSSSGSGLSGGAIAGIVIGVLAGLALIAGAIYTWRLRNQRKNLRRQNESVRTVKWDQTERPSTNPSDTDVELRNVQGQRA